MLTTVLIVILTLMLIGAIPAYNSWGLYPAGGLGLIVIILIVILLLGR